MKDNSGKSKMAFSRHRISLLNLLLLFVLAVAALSADFSAKGLLPVCFHRWGECLHFISAALGLNYNDSLEILEANYAVILAVVSVAVVVLPLLIADREKKIFGIRRDELREEPNGAHFIWSMVRVMTCMPVALLVAIMAGWCVTGYVLLFYTLVGMVAVSLYYLHSHIANAEADELTEWLFHYTDKTQYVYSRDIMAYREFLEDIESGADKGDDWHNVARVLRKLLKRALAKPPKQAYVTIYFYVAVLYRHVSANQRNCLLQIYNIWLECVLSENKACGQKPQAPDDEDDILQGWKEEVLLWAILSAAMEWATMENVVTFF